MTTSAPALLDRLLARKTAWAIVLVAPSIFSAVTSWSVSVSIDADLKAVTERRDARAADLRALDDFTKQFQAFQLFRAAFLVGLDASKAEMGEKLALDRLFRLNAQAAIRRVIATVYPDDWQARMEPSEALLATRYEAASVPVLQAMENAVDAAAGHKLVTLQEEVNALSARHDDLSAKKDRWTTALTYAGFIVSAFVFFLKTAQD